MLYLANVFDSNYASCRRLERSEDFNWRRLLLDLILTTLHWEHTKYYLTRAVMFYEHPCSLHHGLFVNTLYINNWLDLIY